MLKGGGSTDTAPGMNMEHDWTCVVKHTLSQHIRGGAVSPLDIHAHDVPKCALFMYGLTHVYGCSCTDSPIYMGIYMGIWVLFQSTAETANWALHISALRATDHALERALSF
jgi:hypothetical protein